MDHIKQRLRAKPPSQRRPNRLVRKPGILVVHLDRLAASTSRSRIRQKLCIAAFLQTHEPKHGLLDRPSDRQQAVVLQESGFVIAQCSGDALAFFLSKDDSLELFVDDVVLRN
jgi:hypothetical protein